MARVGDCTAYWRGGLLVYIDEKTGKIKQGHEWFVGGEAAYAEVGRLMSDECRGKSEV